METAEAGTQIGQYLLEEKLGEGGMAEVWRARNTVLGHMVAIKFLTRQFAGNADVERRFLDEGKRQAMLQHKNIVSAFDFLYVDGRSFLVMRFIEGRSLDQRLFELQAPMPMRLVLSISRDVLSALDYAHARGIVHRDIKPSNILVENSGSAYIVDFGIALALNQERLTRAGISIGTPHYMSPEQIVGSRDLNHLADVYSYGCVLYQMLAQRPPFDFNEEEGNTEYFVQEQHLRTPAQPIRELNPAIPAAVDSVVLRCLEKKAQDRFQSCQELMNALEAAAQPKQVLEPRRTPTVFEATPDSVVPTSQPNRSGSTVFGAPPPAFPSSTPAAPAAAKAPEPVPPQPLPQPAPRGGNKHVIALVGAGVLCAASVGGGYLWYSHRQSSETTRKIETTVQNTVPAIKPAPIHIDSPKPHSNVPVAKQTQAPHPESPATPVQLKQPVIATNQNPRSVPPPITNNTDSAPQTRGASSSPQIGQPPSRPPVQNAAVLQSGVLQCSSASPATYQGKQGFLFQNLPRHLQFSSDFASHWLIHTEHTDESHQNVLLIPKQPGVTSCQVPWRVQGSN